LRHQYIGEHWISPHQLDAMGKTKKGTSSNAETLQCVVALREGNLEAIQTRVIDGGKDVNAALMGDMTPCLVVCEEGHAPALRLLASAGANVNAADDDGATPCFLAAKSGHLDVVSELAELAADLNTQNAQGESPCWAAAQAGHDHIVNALWRRGADVDAAAKDGTTPRAIASKHDRASVVRAFEEIDRSKQAATTPGAAAPVDAPSDAPSTREPSKPSSAFMFCCSFDHHDD
jgi:ankyrin repeat protein